jgi:hypothetical protein
MNFFYDEEGDILDVFFKDDSENTAYAGYELREGIVLFVTADMSPVQLTMVNFHRSTQLPAIHFDLLKKQPPKIRGQLLQLLAAPPLSSFLRIDATTFYGHVMSPAILDAFAKAA